MTIAGHRYIDGGMRSAANADLAEGYEQVVIIAPIAQGFGHMISVGKQAAALAQAGARVIVISPDKAATQAIGRNVLDPARRGAAATAGRAQAAAEAGRVRAVWLSGEAAGSGEAGALGQAGAPGVAREPAVPDGPGGPDAADQPG